MFKKAHTLALALTLSGGVVASGAQAQDAHRKAFSSFPQQQFEVTITNISPGQTFTPQLIITHPRGTPLFELGDEASAGLEVLAEDGNTSPLTDEFANVATDATTIGGLLGPGATTSMIVSANLRRDQLSVAAMLIPTNDTFVGLTGAQLPRRGTATYLAVAYDAGTEVNDQDCANMPGPRCGGEGFNAEGGEGFVHVSNGFHELATTGDSEVLGPQVYDWRNPVARITVRRVN